MLYDDMVVKLKVPITFSLQMRLILLLSYCNWSFQKWLQYRLCEDTVAGTAFSVQLWQILLEERSPVLAFTNYMRNFNAEFVK